MPKKQKQKKNGGKQKKSQLLDEKKKENGQRLSDNRKQEKPRKNPKSSVVKMISSVKIYSHRPLRPGMVVFGFGILFVLLLVWGMQFDVGSAPKAFIEKSYTEPGFNRLLRQ